MNHMSKVRALPCLICEALNMRQSTPTEAHHIRTGVPMARKAPDECTVPLCREHHTGRTGIHGDRSAWNMAKLGEITALGLTIARLTGGVETGDPDELRSTDQNARLHAHFSDLSRGCAWHGQKLPAGVWKRLCVAAYLRECGERPLMVPALDGVGVDVIYERTSKMGKRRMAGLITWVEAFAAEQGVALRDPQALAMAREQAMLPEAA